MIVGIGLPTELRDQAITLGVVAKAFYLLPTNSSTYTHPSIDYARRKRSTSRPSSTEEIINHQHMDYHAAEKLGKEVEDCNAVFPECQNNILTIFSRLLQ
ncbi:unnamed protein product [Brassicogethes aeneus]|uniref:Uncharacterized protein n=1 Tax=Brassicogethes aeneus TaxID=1431903 RepID=A0A9P0FGZ1_BRAAE|nr:unnamed protein product [Brassicogethes aeneus]